MGEATLFQQSALRLTTSEIIDFAQHITLTNADFRFIIGEQLQDVGIDPGPIIIEPEAKNTASAILAASVFAYEKDEEAVLLVAPSDHLIPDKNNFHQSIAAGLHHVHLGQMVTFGINPTHPETGYGYIKLSRDTLDQYGTSLVESFVEKPDQATADKYFRSGNYLWNSGMFVFQSNTLISQMSIHANTLLGKVRDSVQRSSNSFDFIWLERESFISSPSGSIDYVLMEKSDDVVVVPLDAGWNDIGSWSALYDIGDKDSHGNVTKGDVITHNSFNSYINGSNHLIAAIGVENLIIVDTPNATLIANKNKAKDVKQMVSHLNELSRDEQLFHRKVYRPWGWYDSIEVGENFQVKRLNITPGAKLSLQLHHKRSEHWVVVKGIATVTNNEQILILHEGQSTYIPVGIKHSLENQTKMDLEIIEVQTGSYLGEDDIVRFDDIYGRHKY